MVPVQIIRLSMILFRKPVSSFGVMLHQMVKGELPFVGDNWKELGIFPVVPEAALRATLGILARTVERETA